MTLDEQTSELAVCLRNYLNDCGKYNNNPSVVDLCIIVRPFIRRAMGVEKTP